MAWFLNRALTTFRNEVNAAYPQRDKTTDGTVGDEEHQQSTSDHNPDKDGSVDAWDMDKDLRSGNDAAAIEHLKQVFQKHPAARYWIHNRQIAHRSTGWKRERYTGSSPHTEHVHWNSEPTQETSTRPWGVKEDDLDSTQDKMLRELHETYVKATTSWNGKPQTLHQIVRNTGWAVEFGPESSGAWLPKFLEKLAQDVADLRATPPGTVVISDDQLERVLRKVIGSVDGSL